VFSLSLLVGLVISGLIMVVSLGFGDAVAKFLGASREDAALFANTKAYLMGLGVGAIPLTLNVVLSPILQINGDRKRVKFAMFFISGVNCVLNLLAIFVFKLGMLGVGLATSIAEYPILFPTVKVPSYPSLIIIPSIRGINISPMTSTIIPNGPRIKDFL
jgi:Na+-driven multidrug efflux pump